MLRRKRMNACYAQIVVRLRVIAAMVGWSTDGAVIAREDQSGLPWPEFDKIVRSSMNAASLNGAGALQVFRISGTRTGVQALTSHQQRLRPRHCQETT